VKKYVCSVCGYEYDEAAGLPDAGIAPGTKWEDLPADWVCPLCGAAKGAFQEQQAPEASASEEAPINLEEEADLRQLSYAELSVLCSNLAKGCEKQYLAKEAALFTALADYYQGKIMPVSHSSVSALLQKTQEDLDTHFPEAVRRAKASSDRGALRALTWSEKVTRILNGLLARYEQEGAQMIGSTNVWVCDICGFVYIGEKAPDICPVCKVPQLKILQIERGA